MTKMTIDVDIASFIAKVDFEWFSLKMSVLRLIKQIKFSILITIVLFLTSLPCLGADCDTYQQQKFLSGVYIYTAHFIAASKSYNANLEDYTDEHIGFLKSKNVNSIYLGGVTINNYKTFFEILKKHNLPFIVEFETAYFNPEWNDKELARNAIVAADFINKIKNKYDIIAFSIKEEVQPKDTKKLCKYYKEILKYSPDARFQLSLHKIRSAQNIIEPYPALMGAILYPFWFEETDAKYIAPPDFAMNWFNKRAADYYEVANQRNSQFMLTATQGGLLMPKRANTIIKSGGKLAEKASQWANDKEMGWSGFNDSDEINYAFWKYYRLPENCMKALMWSSVVQGAKSFYCWNYRPYLKSDLNLTLKEGAKKYKNREYYDYWNLGTKPLKPNPQLEEFAEAAQEIALFEKLIFESKKDDNSIIEIAQKQIIHSTFSHPQIKGKVVVIVNLNTGVLTSGPKSISIDDEGNLLHYNAHEKSAIVGFKLTTNNDSVVYELPAKQEISSNDGIYSVYIKPGSGKIVLISQQMKD